MEVNPENQSYSEIYLNEELPKNSETNTDSKPIIATGSKEHLLRLQDDLRKAGYRKAK